MPDRFLEIIAPLDKRESVGEILRHEAVRESWLVSEDAGNCVWKAIVASGGADPLLDELEDLFGRVQGFRAVLHSIEATIPRLVEGEPEEPGEKKREALRVSRAELYQDVDQAADLTRLYLLQVTLATVVAAIGLFRDNTAVVIAAMVIAPLLGPNIALALATTLGDKKLMAKALKTAGAGLALAILLSVVLGATAVLDVSVEEVYSRTRVHLTDLLLAFAAGVAGTLAFSTGVSSSLVGVMVAVALLPPAVVAGALLGAGLVDGFLRACLLLGVNLVCVNLAAVTTFRIQGIHPRRFFDAERSKRATWRAIAIWAAMLAALAVLVWWSSRG